MGNRLVTCTNCNQIVDIDKIVERMLRMTNNGKNNVKFHSSFFKCPFCGHREVLVEERI